MAAPEFFGAELQRAVLRRGRALYDLVGSDPRFVHYGRAVGLAVPEAERVTGLAALIRLQGNSNYCAVPDAEVPALRAMIEAEGFAVTLFARWVFDVAALETARRILAETPLPEDRTVVSLGPETEAGMVEAFAETALGCGVLPPSRLAAVTDPWGAGADRTARAVWINPVLHRDRGRQCSLRGGLQAARVAARGAVHPVRHRSGGGSGRTDDEMRRRSRCQRSSCSRPSWSA